jgi:hypothetical protein
MRYSSAMPGKATMPAALAVIICLAVTLKAQDLPRQLSQPGSYQPKAMTTLQQLIEVAQHYRLPMGIEWVQETKTETETAPLPEINQRRTVNDLINAILENSHGYVAQQRDGVLHIAKTDFLDSRENFLNLRLGTFELQNSDVFGAQFLLRTSIRLRLDPERSGYNGGYGHGTPRDDGFDKQNITFAGNNLSVREILNKIVVANDNALWVVQFSPSQKMSDQPFRAVISLNDGQTMPDFHWQFIPLSKQ